MIKATHVGNLPRGPELVPLSLVRDHGEAYDAADPAMTWKKLANLRIGADIADGGIE